MQPLLAHYHSDGSPEQEPSADNPAAIIRIIGLAELGLLPLGSSTTHTWKVGAATVHMVGFASVASATSATP